VVTTRHAWIRVRPEFPLRCSAIWQCGSSPCGCLVWGWRVPLVLGTKSTPAWSSRGILLRLVPRVKMQILLPITLRTPGRECKRGEADSTVASAPLPQTLGGDRTTRRSTHCIARRFQSWRKALKAKTISARHPVNCRNIAIALTEPRGPILKE
jgi:hypothetical protein